MRTMSDSLMMRMVHSRGSKIPASELPIGERP